MSPKSNSTTMARIIALKGMPRRGLICLTHLEPGIAPSRAKAQVQRDVEVTQPTPQTRARTNIGMVRQKAPASFPTADFKMTGTGWPEGRLASILMSGRTNARGTSVKSPERKLSNTPPTRALGTCTAGW